MQYRDTCNELSVHLSLPTISTVANAHAHVTLTSIDYAVIYIHICKTDERIFMEKL